MIRPVRASLLLAALLAPLSAQEDAAPQSDRRAPRTSVHRYSESVSRDLFRACDADSDDRLDVFEASSAPDAVRDPQDSEAFQRFDTDRDGYVSWPEFDRSFWNLVQRGGAFHVRPCRSLVDQAPEGQEARPSSPLRDFLRMFDRNGNGGLDPEELEQMARTTNLPPAISGELRSLDLDHSGRVEEAELAPWFELLRGLVPGAGRPAKTSTSTLPPPWQSGDVDQDGRIDQAEFTAMLRRLDATLVRWAAQLLRSLDRDRDGRLSPSELPAPERTERHGTAAAAPEAAPAVAR